MTFEPAAAPVVFGHWIDPATERGGRFDAPGRAGHATDSMTAAGSIEGRS